MKLLYGTGNQAKLSAMRSRLKQLDIELIGLDDLRAEGKTIPQVVEDGKSPLENARLKAIAYYEAFNIPVFSCDSGLYFDNLAKRNSYYKGWKDKLHYSEGYVTFWEGLY